MMRRIPVLAVAAVIASTTVAVAGGFSRGTANTDILFEDGTVNFDATATYVNPNRKYERNAVPALDGTEYSDSYIIPSFAAKYSFNEYLSCAATYTTPFGGDSINDVMNSRGKVEEKFITREYGATCAVFMPMDKGRIAFMGGVFYETFDYDFGGFTRVGPFVTPIDFSLQSHDVGFRGGVAYEIPEIAFRTQLLYRSGTKHEDKDGEAYLPAFGLRPPLLGAGELPQSVELKVQSGIAPGWLAFGSLKWTDWSVLDTLDINLNGQALSNEYYWRDGLTITGGIGHEFTDRISGAVSFTYDRGVSTGWDLYGDTYSTAVSASIKDNWGGKLSAALAVAYQKGEEETKFAPGLNSSSKNSWGTGIQLRYSLKF